MVEGYIVRLHLAVPQLCCMVLGAELDPMLTMLTMLTLGNVITLG